MKILDKLENHLKKKEEKQKEKIKRYKEFKKKYSRSIKLLKKLWGFING